MQRCAGKAIAPSYTPCLRSENQEVVKAEAAAVSLVARLEGLEMKEWCHGKEDRFAGAMVAGVVVML